MKKTTTTLYQGHANTHWAGMPTWSFCFCKMKVALQVYNIETTLNQHWLNQHWFDIMRLLNVHSMLLRLCMPARIYLTFWLILHTFIAFPILAFSSGRTKYLVIFVGFVEVGDCEEGRVSIFLVLFDNGSFQQTVFSTEIYFAVSYY